jgi:hypothetical protein
VRYQASKWASCFLKPPQGGDKGEANRILHCDKKTWD